MGAETDAAMDTAGEVAQTDTVAAGKRAAEGPAEGEPASKQAATETDAKVKEEEDVKLADVADTQGEQAPADETKDTMDTDVKIKDEAEEDERNIGQDEEMTGEEKKQLSEVFPLKLGPRTFESLDSCLSYFRGILKMWPENVPLNEYEHLVLSDLLKTCHPRPRSKIGPGIVAFKTKTIFEHASTCFFACHEGGTEVDFSYLKCMSNKVGFPIQPRKQSARRSYLPSDTNARGMRGRGRGRGSRGRGGRRTRGRGRGRK